MPRYSPTGGPVEHADLGNMVTLTHLIYGLHAFAVLSGIAGSATIIGSFVASVPSIVAVLLNYWKRERVRGTWLDSHFRWQIRTFWFAVLWIVASVLLALTLIGIPFALLLIALAGLWIVYRIARGWWNLLQRDMMPVPREV